MSTTVYECLFDKLQECGFKVYSPGVKTGECTSPYIVIKLDGSTQHPNFSSSLVYYSVMLFIPKNQYSKLEKILDTVKKALKELYPLIIPSGIETSSYYDDTYKAYMTSIQYKNYRKIYRRN